MDVFWHSLSLFFSNPGYFYSDVEFLCMNIRCMTARTFGENTIVSIKPTNDFPSFPLLFLLESFQCRQTSEAPTTQPTTFTLLSFWVSFFFPFPFSYGTIDWIGFHYREQKTDDRSEKKREREKKDTCSKEYVLLLLLLLDCLCVCVCGFWLENQERERGGGRDWIGSFYIARRRIRLVGSLKIERKKEKERERERVREFSLVLCVKDE